MPHDTTASAPHAVALFDMDRTLVRKNTASLYTRYRRDLGEATMWDSLQVGWWVAQYTVGLVDAEGVAAKALGIYRGYAEEKMAERCRGWFRDYVRTHIPEAARSAVAWHQRRGEPTAIVTGSTRYAAEPLAHELGIDLVICTELECDPEGRLTGQFMPPLCLGLGKLARTRKALAQKGLTLAGAAFYSDSITDLPLLEAVERPVAVNPDFRLRRVARRRGWPIERW